MPTSRTPVYILLLSANEGSGVTATMATVANGLVEHHPVEVISLLRFAEEPTFRFDPRVKLTYLKDERPQTGQLARARRFLKRRDRRLDGERSKLIPDVRRTTALTDRRLERKLRSITSGVVISNRPLLHQAASLWLPPQVDLLAVEHATHPQRGPVVIGVYREHISRFRAMVTLTEGDRAAWARELGEDAPIVVIPNAVPKPGAVVSTLDRPVIVAAGELIGRKGFDRLIDAYAPLAEGHPDWQLHIYGKGPERRALRKKIEDLGLEGKVVLKGFDPSFQASIAQASLYTMASHFEAFPMVLLEAMGAGLPVIAFDCPTGPRHLISDGVDGMLVPDGDVPAYTEALRRLMDDEALRKKMGAAALETIKDYSIEAIVARWRQHFPTAG